MTTNTAVLVQAHLTCLDKEMVELELVIVTIFLSLPCAPTVLDEAQKQQYINMKRNQRKYDVLTKRFNRIFNRYYPQVETVLLSTLNQN